MAKINGVAKKFDGTAIDYVHIFEWSLGQCIATITPNPTSGSWEFECFFDLVIGISYVANGCEPITHGPYVIEIDNGVSVDDVSVIFRSGELGIWYDPSDLSTMFKDVAGNQPVTKSGDSVALLRDKSGNGYNATQSILSNRPKYRTDGVSHWLEFDGVDDRLDINALNLFRRADKGEMYVAVDSIFQGDTRRVVDFNNGISNGARFAYYKSIEGNEAGVLGARRLDSDSFNSVAGKSKVNLKVVSLQMSWEDGSARFRYYKEGWSNNYAITTKGLTSDTPSTGASIGGMVESGRFDIYGLIVRRKNASDARVLAIEQYLAKKIKVRL